jgi:hypothetical protein
MSKKSALVRLVRPCLACFVLGFPGRKRGGTTRSGGRFAAHACGQVRPAAREGHGDRAVAARDVGRRTANRTRDHQDRRLERHPRNIGRAVKPRPSLHQWPAHASRATPILGHRPGPEKRTTAQMAQIISAVSSAALLWWFGDTFRSSTAPPAPARQRFQRCRRPCKHWRQQANWPAQPIAGHFVAWWTTACNEMEECPWVAGRWARWR